MIKRNPTPGWYQQQGKEDRLRTLSQDICALG
jgi:hypothetical protein